RLARRDLPHRAHRRARAIRSLQDRRSVLPQLDRARDGATRSTDLRLPALQQELRSLLLRARSLMLKVLLARFHQGHLTAKYPNEPPAMPDRFRGAPALDSTKCPDGCSECADACPTVAIQTKPLALDMGRCLFCTECVQACPAGAIEIGREYRLAARKRE